MERYSLLVHKQKCSCYAFTVDYRDRTHDYDFNSARLVLAVEIYGQQSDKREISASLDTKRPLDKENGRQKDQDAYPLRD